VEGSLRAKYQLDSSDRFDTIPACDRWTDTNTHDVMTMAYTAQ